ncbi:MAG: nucleotide exchange factor GrpE [Bacteroidota bacterium]
MSKKTKAEKVAEEEIKNSEQEIEIEGAEKSADEAEVEVKNEGESPENQGDSNFATLDDAMKVIADLQQQLKDAQAALADKEDQVLRLNADFANLRKRQQIELSNTIEHANEGLLVKLLPVLDDFDRTLSAIEKTDNLSAVKDGINLVNNSMRKRLAKTGLEPIDSMGKEFDTELHEAITTIPAADDSLKGKVVDEVEKGYKLKDKVIRFSKVVVGE